MAKASHVKMIAAGVMGVTNFKQLLPWVDSTLRMESKQTNKNNKISQIDAETF